MYKGPIRYLLFSIFFFLAAKSEAQRFQPGPDAVYQYSIIKENRRIYLWVPPQTDVLKGAIVAISNLLERCWLEDPVIRRMASKEKLCIIWIGPSHGTGKPELFSADMKPGAAEVFKSMLSSLADESGFRELKDIPIIATGHSANGQFSWNLAKAMPERVIAAIAVKTVPIPPNLHLNGVPLCYMVGQFTEWPQFRVPDPRSHPGDREFFWPVVVESAIKARQQDSTNAISVVVEAGGGHFDWSLKQARFMAAYIRKACEYRLSKIKEKGPDGLVPIKIPTGWLTDHNELRPAKYSAAPYDSYEGDRTQAFWYFDKELALRAVGFEKPTRVKKRQMLSYFQGDTLTPVAHLGYAQLKFEPDSDGRSFHLRGGFLDRVPPELINSGAPLGNGGGKIVFSVVTGPAVQTGPNDFRIEYSRENEGAAIWFQAENGGNSYYQRAVQPGKMETTKKMSGQPQSIQFGGDSVLHIGSKIGLSGISSAGLPVYYFVVSGPALIKGKNLVPMDIPHRATFPLKIIVKAYQLGKDQGSVKFLPAEPVTKNFYLYE